MVESITYAKGIITNPFYRGIAVKTFYHRMIALFRAHQGAHREPIGPAGQFGQCCTAHVAGGPCRKNGLLCGNCHLTQLLNG